MFRSAENLRLAADMRALQRVAAPWRQARSTWFDGTPESIEGRLAATERVLTYARGGVTPAHMALEREASIARAELKEAAHRLMVDFLDDSARAFKGSKRVALDYGHGDINEPCNRCGAAPGEPCLDVNHFRPEDDPRQKKVRYLEDEWGARRQSGDPHPYDVHQQDPELFNKLHWGSRRVAGDGDPLLDHQNAMDSARGDHDYREFIHQHLRDTGPGMGEGEHDEDALNYLFGHGHLNNDGTPRTSSRRVAKERGLRECINCGGALSGEQDDDKESECGTCGMSAHEKGVDWRRKKGHRLAVSWGGMEAPDDECLNCGHGIDFDEEPDLDVCPACGEHPIYTSNPYHADGR
jgi:predicted RNA-binding Zn-ribbon protein involved in translation (DUF1610 family)